MADTDKKAREIRKNRFRKNMTVNKELEEGEQAQDEPKPGASRIRVILILLAVFVVLVILLVLRWQKDNGAYTEVKQAWAVEMTDTNFSQFAKMANGIVRYSRDGASYYDKEGDMVWNQAYEMVDPIIAVHGGHLAIADRNSYTAYLFDEKGTEGTIRTNLPISRVAIAGNGVAALILEDKTANYISLYSQDGSALDIEIKTILSGDGYPIDISLSEEGTILMASFAYLSQGMMQNKVVFYNFSEAGKNMVQRIVGGFQQYEAAIVPDVEMLGQKAAVAFADDRLSFYSLKNEVSPELVNEVVLEEEVKSIFVSEAHVGVILSSAENVKTKVLVVYDASGDEVFRQETELMYQGANFAGSHVVLYSENQCEIYSMSGKLRYSGELLGSITRLDYLGGAWYQIGGQEMKKLEFN